MARTPSYARDTEAGKTRLWLNDLPEDTVFRLRDVPATPAARERVLARLSREPRKTGIRQLIKGLYYKGAPIGDHPESGWWDAPWCPSDVIRVHAGPGSGFAGRSALSHLGWIDQVPVVYDAAVMRHVTAPSIEGFSRIVYHRRGNPLRVGLTFGEVTLLEACRDARLVLDLDARTDAMIRHNRVELNPGRVLAALDGENGNIDRSLVQAICDGLSGAAHRKARTQQ